MDVEHHHNTSQKCSPAIRPQLYSRCHFSEPVRGWMGTKCTAGFCFHLTAYLLTGLHFRLGMAVQASPWKSLPTSLSSVVVKPWTEKGPFPSVPLPFTLLCLSRFLTVPSIFFPVSCFGRWYEVVAGKAVPPVPYTSLI